MNECSFLKVAVKKRRLRDNLSTSSLKTDGTAHMAGTNTGSVQHSLCGAGQHYGLLMFSLVVLIVTAGFWMGNPVPQRNKVESFQLCFQSSVREDHVWSISQEEEGRMIDIRLPAAVGVRINYRRTLLCPDITPPPPARLNYQYWVKGFQRELLILVRCFVLRESSL